MKNQVPEIENGPMGERRVANCALRCWVRGGGIAPEQIIFYRDFPLWLYEDICCPGNAGDLVAGSFQKLREMPSGPSCRLALTREGGAFSGRPIC
jgi:hypothetical protein